MQMIGRLTSLSRLVLPRLKVSLPPRCFRLFGVNDANDILGSYKLCDSLCYFVSRNDIGWWVLIPGLTFTGGWQDDVSPASSSPEYRLYSRASRIHEGPSCVGDQLVHPATWDSRSSWSSNSRSSFTFSRLPGMLGHCHFLSKDLMFW